MQCRQSDWLANPYKAPAWLRGAHLQTIWPAKLAPKPRVTYRRERWDTPDGDFIDVDLLVAPSAHRSSPFVVLFHGLEGNSHSHYARSIMRAVQRAGWRGAVAHFRGCSGEPNRLPRAYHSGDSDEIDWILNRFAATHASLASLHAVGVSLGGNALLKWLGERAQAAGFVSSAVAVSPPQDLAAGAQALSCGMNRLYTANFLRTLRRKSLEQIGRHPGLFNRERMLAARDFHEFDDTVTAPLHGFASGRDYWKRASCKPVLGGIRVPTAIIHALNDPFLPSCALAGRSEVSREVRLDYSDEGGHAGFATGVPPGRLDWLPRRVLSHLGAAPHTGDANHG
jgi:predicted alpha/beta-fold hydrolase